MNVGFGTRKAGTPYDVGGGPYWPGGVGGAEVVVVVVVGTPYSSWGICGGSVGSIGNSGAGGGYGLGGPYVSLGFSSNLVT